MISWLIQLPKHTSFSISSHIRWTSSRGILKIKVIIGRVTNYCTISGWMLVQDWPSCWFWVRLRKIRLLWVPSNKTKKYICWNSDQCKNCWSIGPIVQISRPTVNDTVPKALQRNKCCANENKRIVVVTSARRPHVLQHWEEKCDKTV